MEAVLIRRHVFALLEVDVVHGLLGADASGRVVHKQALEEVEATVTEDLDAVSIDELLVGLPFPLREAALEVGEAGDAGPVVFTGRAEDAEDFEDLVDFRVTGEERLAGGHLGEDAADRPHVDAGAVLAAAEQDLGSAVPEGDDFVGVGAERNAEGTGQAKVGELQVALFVDEEVLRLEVAVQDTVGVAVAHAIEKLEGEFLDLSGESARHASVSPSSTGSYHVRAQSHVSLAAIHDTLGQGLATSALADGKSLHVALEVEVEVLEDEVQLVAVGVDDVEQADNVRVVHLLEQGDFADGGRRNAFVLGLEADLLERDDALVRRGQVAGLVDDAVGTWRGRSVKVAQAAIGHSRMSLRLPSPIFSIF